MRIGRIADVRAEQYRKGVRRAQLVALKTTSREMHAHIQQAVELGQTVNAQRLADAYERWVALVEVLEEEDR